MAEDYYKTLGVDKSASKAEIKKAYRKLARKYHPDVSKEKDSEVKFKEINAAADILMDDNKKQQYDTYGSSDGSAGAGSQGFGGGGFSSSGFGANMEDIFEQFGFGGGGGFSGFGGSSRSRRTQQKDTRIYVQAEITLDDVYFGVKKTISITRDEKCSECSGKGAKNSSDIETCSTCNGAGVVTEMQRSILGNIRTQRTCPTCSGEGKQIKNPCSSCSGKGTESKRTTVELKIPAGVENGVTLRVSNKGHYDKTTDSYGDLYLKIYVKSHKTLEVDETDLYMNLDINFISAILGDEIEFKHFDKTLSLKVPQGTQSGSVLRIKGKGLPYFNYNSKGDLYIKINVNIPTKTTKEQKRILHEYAKTIKDKGFLSRLKGIFK